MRREKLLFPVFLNATINENLYVGTYTRILLFLAFDKNEAIEIGTAYLKIQCPPNYNWYNFKVFADDGLEKKRIEKVFDGTDSINGTTIYSENDEKQLRELEDLLVKLDSIAQQRFRNTNKSFSEKIIECSSSSDDGFYIFLIAEVGLKPGAYFAYDGIGGSGTPLKVNDKIGCKEIFEFIFHYTGGETSYTNEEIKQWIQNNWESFVRP